MIRSFVVVLCILPALVLAPARAAQAQGACTMPPQPAGAAELPSNIQIDPLLQPIVDALRAKSETFRCQWRRITASRFIRITVVPSNDLREAGSARARTQLTRYAYGAMRAIVELPPAVDVTELLPHEFEHVIEQIEGLDLPALAKRGDRGVLQVQRGVFETERARSAAHKQQ